MFSFLFRKPTNKMYYCNDNITNMQGYIRKIEKDLNKKELIVPSKVKTNSYDNFLLPFVSIVFFLLGYNLKNG